MPTFKNQIEEQELLDLLEYIKSLGTSNGGRNSAAAAPSTPGVAQNENAPLASPRGTRQLNEPLAGATQQRDVPSATQWGKAVTETAAAT